MQLLVLVSVVLGVAYATPFLPRNDPNVAAARANFIQEYNRLAALAAAAPDINIIMDDRTHPSVVNNRHQQQQHNHHTPVFHQQQQHNPQVTVFRQQQQQIPKVSVIRHQQQPQPVSEDPPANIAAARTIFIQEYNRLAALAAAAPDTNIIMSNRNQHSVVNNRHQQQQHNHQVPVVRQQQQNIHQVPVVHQQQQPRPVSEDPPANIAAARTIFIQEYNRLAALAAAAPDTHIIMSDRTHSSVVNNRHQQQQHNRQQQSHQVPVVRQQQQPRPVSLRQPANPAFNQYSFSTTLGDNQQVFPQSNFIKLVSSAPVQRRQHNNAHNAGGNLAGHIAAAPTSIFNEPTRWTGPFSHTLPAGVNGFPQQVADTPEVAAAKAEFFRAHALARANNPVL